VIALPRALPSWATASLILTLSVPLVGPLGCEQRFSSDPPAVPESPGPASSSSAIDALFAPISADAGRRASEVSHAMTITLCASSLQPCPGTDASADVMYRVVFGSGRGEVRSSAQAMADLYEELRNRTAAGERLDAEAHAPGDAGAVTASGRGSTANVSAGSSDPISRCAFHLLHLVDAVGEVDLNIVHGSGSSGCMVWLGHSATGARAPECLIEEADRARHPGRKGN
jgi:hypothetical protein